MKTNKFIKAIWLLIAAAMMFSMISFGAFATDEVVEEETDGEIVHAEFNPDDWMTAGHAVYDIANNRFTLTTLKESISGAIWYNYAYEEDFTLEFDYYIGDGEDYRGYGGADGIAVSFYADFNYSISTGGSLGFSGSFGGYGIELDTYNGNTNDPSYNHIALIQGSTSNHVVNARLDEAEDKSYHHLKIEVKGSDCIVSVDGTEKFTYSGINRTGKGWIGISAATGGGINNHAVKNIEITGKRSSNEKFFNASLSHKVSNYNTSSDKLNGVYEYEIKADITNNAPATAPGVKSTITLDNNLTLLSSATVNVGDICGKQTKTATWKVISPWPIEDITAHYSVETTITNISTKFVNEHDLLVERMNVVSFDANGGSGEMASYGVKDGELEFPSCGFTAPEGYGFYGWALTSDGDVIDELSIHNQDITLYPVWVKLYNVHLLSNNSYNESKTLSMFEGSRLPGCDFTEPIHVMFKGWSLTPDGEILSSDYRITSDTTLYAVWEKFYIIWVGNDGDYYRFFYGENDLPSCTLTPPEGYLFDGWSYSPDGEIISGKLNVTEDTSIYPVWAKAYTISFDASGGSGVMDPVVWKAGTYFSTECLFTAPDGMIFVGWSLTPGGELFGEIKVNGDLTLYANWKEYYTVSFDPNGGNGAMNPVYIAIDRDYKLPDCGFEQAGYKFVGWSLTPDGERVDSIAREDTVLYALWVKICNISFNANGGSGEMEDIKGLHVGSILMPTCTFTAPEGYKIKGWALTPDGEVLEGEMLELTGDVTLYAIWEKIENNSLLGKLETYFEGVLGIDITKDLILLVVLAVITLLGFIGLWILAWRKTFNFIW